MFQDVVTGLIPPYLIGIYLLVGFVSEVYLWIRYVKTQARYLRNLKSLVSTAEYFRLAWDENPNWVARFRKANGWPPSRVVVKVFNDGDPPNRTNGIHSPESVVKWLSENPPRFRVSTAAYNTLFWPILMTKDLFLLVRDSVRHLWRRAQDSVQKLTDRYWNMLTK